MRLLASLLAGVLALGVAMMAPAARAEPIRIVALGASDTTGYGVGPQQAWPAELEGLLRAKGYDVTVTVNAVNGATSADILSRTAGAVTPGTRVVIYETGIPNDKRKGIPPEQSAANIDQVVARIRAVGAVPIPAGKLKLAASYMQPDGEHANAAGHALMASRLVPQVIAAIGKRK